MTTGPRALRTGCAERSTRVLVFAADVVGPWALDRCRGQTQIVHEPARGGP
ncbi:hypothetical protein [Sinosporangium album]|uniref:hypothetical protein n=1 Tax=Sinosporangium album TaxID=504805 RepID=UPI0015A156A7|nr:hypothetical protein [Sinosporangium album]